MTTKYLSELIFDEFENLFFNQSSFSAWDITKAIRDRISDEGLFIEDVISKNISHDRIKEFVHRFMSFYTLYSSQSNGKYIIYSPSLKKDQATTNIEIVKTAPRDKDFQKNQQDVITALDILKKNGII